MTPCSDFPSEALLRIKEVEMVDSMDELTSSRSVASKNFPNFGNVGREDRFSFEQDHPKFEHEEEGQSGGTESTERGSSFLRGTQISFMIYDYSRVTGAQDTLLGYADLFSVILCDEVHTK